MISHQINERITPTISMACYLTTKSDGIWQKQKMLKAKIAAALYHEEGRVPTTEEIEKWTKFAKVLYTAVLYMHRKILHLF
jgi:hypothetical protein